MHYRTEGSVRCACMVPVTMVVAIACLAGMPSISETLEACEACDELRRRGSTQCVWRGGMGVRDGDMIADLQLVLSRLSRFIGQ